MSTALITTDYIKPFIGVSPSDTSKDALLTALIAGASDVISGYLNRNLLTQTYSEFYDFDQADKTLTLRQYPVTALTSVTLYCDGQATVVNASNFVWKSNGLVRFAPTSAQGWYFPQGFQNVKVDYTAGFSSVPNDIQIACALMIQRVYYNLARNPLVTSERLGDYAVTYKSALEIQLLTPDVESVLSRYRSIPV